MMKRFDWNLAKKGFYLISAEKRGILPGEVVLDFLNDCGLVKTWKLLSGIIGFNQGEVSSSFLNTDEANKPSNWSGSDMEGND